MFYRIPRLVHTLTCVRAHFILYLSIIYQIVCVRSVVYLHREYIQFNYNKINISHAYGIPPYCIITRIHHTLDDISPIFGC